MRIQQLVRAKKIVTRYRLFNPPVKHANKWINSDVNLLGTVRWIGHSSIRHANKAKLL